MKQLNGPLTIFMVAVAVGWMLTHSMPGYVKFGLVVAAYVLAIHWLGQYYPRLARGIASFTVLVIFGIISGILSMGKGGRR